MKILVMGLPGSGKTYLSEKLQKYINCAWFNADQVRRMANDWEFSEAARLRQAYRMKSLADFESEMKRTVICDFVCPLKEMRDIFEADITIWMNTIQKGRFEDTNKAFVPPAEADYTITKFMTDEEILRFVNALGEVHEI